MSLCAAFWIQFAQKSQNNKNVEVKLLESHAMDDHNFIMNASNHDKKDREKNTNSHCLNRILHVQRRKQKKNCECHRGNA